MAGFDAMNKSGSDEKNRILEKLGTLQQYDKIYLGSEIRFKFIDAAHFLLFQKTKAIIGRPQKEAQMID